jgi:hypothetical protein
VQLFGFANFYLKMLISGCVGRDRVINSRASQVFNLPGIESRSLILPFKLVSSALKLIQ